jgi:hypothetical protein
MELTTYAFTHGLDYTSIVAASEQVAWTVNAIFRDRRFVASKPMVPASWVRTQDLAFLMDRDHLTLNHCRAFSYAHLNGNYEEFIPLHLTGIIQQDWHADRTHLRALLRFGEEEMKHQQLFRRTETVLEASCGHPFGRYFDDHKVRVTELTHAVLEYPPLPRFLLLLAFEFGTRRHYAESMHDHTGEGADPLYAEVLKAHWLEEAQHVKSDMLEIARLARAMSPEELSVAFDQMAGIGALVDATLMGQVGEEIATLQQVTGRMFSEAEMTRLRDTLYHSLQAIIAGVSLTDPSFRKVALELSPAGAAKLGIV